MQENASLQLQLDEAKHLHEQKIEQMQSQVVESLEQVN